MSVSFFLIYFSLSLSWCTAMVFPLKISSTVEFANKSPRLNTLLRTALTSWCVIMKQSYARFLAVTPMPSKCLISLALVPVPVIMWLESCYFNIGKWLDLSISATFYESLDTIDFAGFHLICSILFPIIDMLVLPNKRLYVISSCIKSFCFSCRYFVI